MKKIMILGASILQLPAIIKAKEMGLQVIAVDMDKNAIGFEHADIRVEASTIDIPEVLKAAKNYNIDGIITLASDMPMSTVTAVAKELNLESIDEETTFKATNKAIMRDCLYANEVPVPRYQKVRNKAEYLEAVSSFPDCFIVKPADNSGSRGVFLIEDIADQKKISEVYDYSRRYSHNGDVVVEEYMRGPEVSVETLTVNGKCHVIQITDKITTGAPYFVEMGHSQPTRHSQEIADRIRQVAKAANKAIGIVNGPSHTEIIVTATGPRIVEIGARLGGDCITTHLVPLSTGVNMVECCINIALREKPDLEKKFERGSAIRYLQADLGMIRNIAGVKEAEAIDGVQQVSIVRGIGQEVVKIKSSADRVGFIIAQAPTAEEAIRLCIEADKRIEIITM